MIEIKEFHISNFLNQEKSDSVTSSYVGVVLDRRYDNFLAIIELTFYTEERQETEGQVCLLF